MMAMAFNMILNEPQAVLYYELQSHRKIRLGQRAVENYFNR